MRAVMGQIPEQRGRFQENRPHDYGMANALARKVRREWPSGTIDQTAAEYDLTPGEAKGVVYGTASRSTIDKVLKRGGWGLAVELFADLIGQPLEHFIEEQAERARREEQRWAAEARAAETRLAALSRTGERSWSPVEPPRGRRATDAEMGGRPDAGDR